MEKKRFLIFFLMIMIILLPQALAFHGHDDLYTTLFISSVAYLGEANTTTGNYEAQVSLTFEPTGYGNFSSFEIFLGYIHVANIDLPLIAFWGQTLLDGTLQLTRYIEINVSINDSIDIEEIKFNWDGTNYSAYDNSLVLMMNFENMSTLSENNTFIKDQSIYGNDGSCSGASCPIWTSNGRYGGAYNFDGINDSIDSGRTGLDLFTEDFSMFVWIKRNSFSQYTTIIEKRQADNDGYRLYIAPDDSIGCSINAIDIIDSTITITDNEWHYAGCVMDRNGNGVMYLDGIRQDATITPLLSEGISSTQNLMIGKSYTGAGAFNGTMDELRIWNRTLSDEEAQQQYFMNLKKYNINKWELYINQSKNSTDGLFGGTYTYCASAKNVIGGISQTEERTVTIDSSPQIYNVTVTDAFNNETIPNGSYFIPTHNFTLNVTASANTDTMWVRFWQGLVTLWSGFLTFVTDHWFVEFETNESWQGEVNYTINATSALGEHTYYNGSIIGRTLVYNCINISEPGEYVLMNDIIDSSTDNCIYINASEVVFDCQNYLVDGDGLGTYRGLFLNYVNNSAIRNCRVSGWDLGGILLSHSENNTLMNIDVSDQEGNFILIGIYLESSNNNYFINITSNNNALGFADDSGLSLSDSSYNLFENIFVTNNLNGITLTSQSNHNEFYNLNSSLNYEKGIYIVGSDNNTFYGSNIKQNLLNIYFESIGVSSQNNTFYNNHLGNSSFFYSDFQFNSSNGYNYFNSSLSSYNLGNWWDDMGCSLGENRGPYAVCIDPDNYTINTTNNMYDFAPMVNPKPAINSSRIDISIESNNSINLLGYCNASDIAKDGLAYEYKWYNGSEVLYEGTLFKEGSISAGGWHSCAIRANDSRVLCWGSGTYGRLADGNIASHENPVPTLILDSSEYSYISSGEYHTCGIRQNDSRVLCWGENNYGQLGNGGYSDTGIPIQISDTSEYSVVSAGFYHTCGIRQNDSRVLCWGSGSSGTLGDGDDTIHNVSVPQLTTGQSKYLIISAGAAHTCGVRQDDSRVLCWGFGNFGRLGDGITINHNNPYPNLVYDNSSYMDVSAGYGHTCGIRLNDSRVLCWGEGDYGQLGDGDGSLHNVYIPKSILDSSAYNTIVVGERHTCGIRQDDSRVLCWGEGGNGQLGDNNTAYHETLYTTVTTDDSPYNALTAGTYHTCGVRQDDSRVLCWGEGDYGQLGDGDGSSHEVGNPTLTVDTSTYIAGFTSSKEILVSNLPQSLLTDGDSMTFSCRAYDYLYHSDWMNSSSLLLDLTEPVIIDVDLGIYNNIYFEAGDGVFEMGDNITLNVTTEDNIDDVWAIFWRDEEVLWSGFLPNITDMLYSRVIPTNQSWTGKIDYLINVTDTFNRKVYYGGFIHEAKFITDCKDLNESRTYVLTQDIINSATSYCINISANDVTLDCQGNTIDGNDIADNGVYMYREIQEITNITVKNCIVSDWDFANIYFRRGEGNSIKNIISYSSPDYGFYLYSFDNNNSIINITSYSNTYGLYLRYFDDNHIANVTLYSNGDGFYARYYNYNSISNVNSYSNANNGFWIMDSNDNIIDNISSHLNNYGFSMYDSGYNNLTNLRIHSNNVYGFRCSDCQRQIMNNSFSYNNSFDMYEIAGDSSYCTNDYVNVSDNYGDLYYYFNNTPVNINGWTNISGLILCNADFSNIENLSINNNLDRGIIFSVTQTNKSNFTNLNSSGFYLTYSGSNELDKINSTGSSIGIYLEYSQYNIIKNINTYLDFYGMYLYRSDLNNLINIDFSSNTYGLFIEQSNYNNISGITAHLNINEGLYTYRSDFNNWDNLSSYSNNGDGLYIEDSNFNNWDNLSFYSNNGDGISIYDSDFNNLTNLNVYLNDHGIFFNYDSDGNIIFNSSIIDNSISNIHIDNIGTSTPINNTFYNNHLGSSSMITCDDWTQPNYFNSSLSGYNIGNWWDDFGICYEVEERGNYTVCLNPSNYTINQTNNIYDFAPLTLAEPYMNSVRLNFSTYSNNIINLLGYCNATSPLNYNLAYEYEWYNGSEVLYQGILFKEGSISSGIAHTCGIRANDSSVLCWGWDAYGQLGDGSVGGSNPNPILINDSSAYSSVSTGGYHTCGVRASDGRVLCWGNDAYGQLGDGVLGPDNSNPSLTSDSSAYLSITSGADHSCGIRQNDSRVLCWGWDAYGQLGDGVIGVPNNNSNPSLTSDSSAYLSITSGAYHSCGIRQNDSRALCWGSDGAGELGDGVVGPDNPNPSLINNSSVYLSVSAGSYYSCGVRQNDSRVLCWGWDAYGQLGDGIIGSNNPNPSLTIDTSAYGVGFSSSEEILVSTLPQSLLSDGDDMTFSCRAYDFEEYSDWMNSSSLLLDLIAPNITDVTIIDEIHVDIIPNGSDFNIGDNLTVNVTVEDNIVSIFIRFWQGLVTLWEGFLTKISEGFYSRNISTNESWLGEVNYTITATDTFNRTVTYEGSMVGKRLIYDCADINESGEYYLHNNIIDSSTNYCINISVNDVIIDCQGFTIDGDKSAMYGIYISRGTQQSTNITINRCNIKEWVDANIYLYNSNSNSIHDTNSSNSDTGIMLYNSSGNNITNNYIYGNNISGIHIYSSVGNLIENISIFDNSGTGIELESSVNNILKDSKVYDNGFGIYDKEISSIYCYNSIINVTDYYGKYYLYFNNTQVNIDGWTNISGLVLCNVDNSDIKNMDNPADPERGIGISLAVTENSNFTNVNASGAYILASMNNTFSSISSYGSISGINMQSSYNNSFNTIRAYQNLINGLFVYNSSGNNFDISFIYENGFDGIALKQSYNNIFSEVYAYNNHRDGISFDSSSNNSLLYLNLVSNMYYGLYLFSKSESNNISESYVNSNNLGNIYFNNTDSSDPISNMFWANYLGTYDMILSDDWTNINHFNNSNVSGYNIGNWWDDLGECYENEERGIYFVCITPSEYAINSTSNIYDFAPLIINPTLMYFQGQTPIDGYNQNKTYVEINVSINDNDIKKIMFNWNGANHSIYDDSLVLMYNFDNISFLGENNNLIKDLSNYGNDAYWQGDATPDSDSGPTSSARYNGAFMVDGNDYLNTSYSSSLDLKGNMTLSVWFNPSAVGGNLVTDFGLQGVSDGKYWLSTEDNGNYIEFGIAPVSCSESYEQQIKVAAPADSITTGTWYYTVARYNGTHLSLYINGILQNSTNYTGGLSDCGGIVNIGALMLGVPSYLFNGSIDEVRIWNRSLTDAEIQQLYFTNLRKYDDFRWELYVNQSKNSTADLDDGEYSYQAYAIDSDDNYAKTEQRTVTIDTIVPTIITLYPPQNHIENDSFGIEFRYEVSDANNISSCMLFMDGSINQTTPDPQRDIDLTFNVTFNNGFYQWKIGCYDLAYNYYETELFNLTIDAEESLTINPIQGINIEENENITLSRNVLLILDIIPTTKYCQYSNDAISWSTWEECTSTKAWKLSDGYGPKTVYARINHTGVAIGKITMINDTITYSESGEELITTQPSDFNVYDEGQYTNRNTTLRFTWTDASNNEMRKLGLGLNYQYMLNDTTSSANLTGWVDVGSQRNATIIGLSLAENHTYVLIVKAINPNSNEKTGLSDGIITDFTKPSIDSIISIPPNNTWSSNNNITINWTASDSISGVKGYSIILDTNPSSSTDSVIDTSSNSIMLNDAEDGLHYLHLRPVDNAGNIGDIYNYGPIKIDTEKPTRAAIDNPNKYVDDTRYNITWAASEDALSGIKEYLVMLYDKDGANTENATATSTYHEFTGLSTGNYHVIIITYDNANNSISTTDPALTPLLIIFVSPNSSNTIINPIVIAKTNKQALCKENITGKAFLYTDSMYHETKVRLPEGTYSLRVSCEDEYGFKDSKTVQFQTYQVLPGAISLSAQPNYYEDQIIEVSLAATENISTIPQKDLELYMNSTRLANNQYNIYQISTNDYIIKINPISVGQYSLVAKYENLVSDDEPIQINALKLTVEYASSITSSKKSTQLVYSFDGNKTIGVATSSRNPNVQDDPSMIGIDSQTIEPAYLFITNNNINIRAKNSLLKENEFKDKARGFGIVKEDNVIRQKLGYDIIGFEGVSLLPKGSYELIMINEGKDEKGKTIIRVEQIGK